MRNSRAKTYLIYQRAIKRAHKNHKYAPSYFTILVRDGYNSNEHAFGAICAESRNGGIPMLGKFNSKVLLVALGLTLLMVVSVSAVYAQGISFGGLGLTFGTGNGSSVSLGYGTPYYGYYPYTYGYYPYYSAYPYYNYPYYSTPGASIYFSFGQPYYYNGGYYNRGYYGGGYHGGGNYHGGGYRGGNYGAGPRGGNMGGYHGGNMGGRH